MHDMQDITGGGNRTSSLVRLPCEGRAYNLLHNLRVQGFSTHFYSTNVLYLRRGFYGIAQLGMYGLPAYKGTVFHCVGTASQTAFK